VNGRIDMGKLSKSQVREVYLAARNTLTAEQVKEKSAEIFNMLKASKLLDNKSNISIYCSFKNEVNTHDIISSLLYDGKTVIVPYVSRDRNGSLTMQLKELKCQAELIKGPMGIPQPELRLQPDGSSAVFEPNKIDVAIIPGVAFDLKHNRIGYGKGMYDKVLPLLKYNCIKIALAFEIQIVPDLIENEEHDIKMDYIITENRIII